MWKCKRVGVYYFSDEAGIVDRYVENLLNNIGSYLCRLVIICGGKLTVESRSILEQYTSTIIVSDDVRNCIEGYQKALEYIARENIENIEEFVLFDNNMMGPVYDLSEMFGTMEQKKVDFWGLVPAYADELEVSYIPFEFIVLRSTFVKSYEVKKLLEETVEEKTFTEYFAKKGFTWDTYIQLDELSNMSDMPTLFFAKELVEEKKCPLFSRKLFFSDYKMFISESIGQSVSAFFEYMKETKVYDINLILDHLLRTCHQADMVKLLQLIFVLPVNTANLSKMEELLKQRRIALVIHIYRTDMAELLIQYASFMPENTDIYVTTDTEQKKACLHEKFRRAFGERAKIRLVENRGRDVSSKLVAMKDVIMQYDYVCFIHDKKTPHIKPLTVGEGFGYKCFHDVLFNQLYAYNVLELFEDNPKLGIAVPPEPNHANFFTTLGYEWVENYENVNALAKKLGIKVPLSRDKEPVAPFGSFFWVRPKALEILYNKNWEYSDFPQEPIADDGTILHAIERIYPFVAQQAGYFPAIIMAEPLARIELTNLRYYLREYNKAFVQHGILAQHEILCKTLDSALSGHSSLQMQVIQLQRELAEMYPRTSLKWQIKDRFKCLLHIR